MQDFGRMINNMAMVRRLGPMEHIMKGSMKKERNMEKENQYLLTVLCMKDSLIIMIYMDMVSIFGQTIENIKESGREIKCMAEEQQLGLMDVVMRESNCYFNINQL